MDGSTHDGALRFPPDQIPTTMTTNVIEGTTIQHAQLEVTRRTR